MRKAKLRSLSNVSKVMQLVRQAKFRPTNVGPIFNHVTSCKGNEIFSLGELMDESNFGALLLKLSLQPVGFFCLFVF